MGVCVVVVVAVAAEDDDATAAADDGGAWRRWWYGCAGGVAWKCRKLFWTGMGVSPGVSRKVPRGRTTDMDDDAREL